MLLLALATALWPVLGRAAAKGVSDAAAPDASDAAIADPMAEDFAEKAEHVRALVRDELGAEIDARSLFDFDVSNADLIALERTRLEGLVRAFALDAGRGPKERAKPSVAGGHGDAGLPSGPPQERWEARLELDRARLSFFELPAARREELLEHHRARVAAAGTADTDRRAVEAESERQRALASAQLARSEAERVVKEEYARLLQVEQDQSAFEKKLAAGRARIEEGREATLVWQRRAREARAGAEPDRADALYDELRKALRKARDELDEALHDAARDDSDVPVAGRDRLAGLQVNADTSAVQAERERVDAAAVRLVREEKDYHDERASQLLDEVDALNAERLALLSHLSAAKRSAIVGFTSAGLEQAASEVRQLTLIARYHRYVASAWLVALREGHGPAGASARTVIGVVLEWLAVLAVFLWLRRRLPIWLQLAWKRAKTEDRRLRLASPSVPSRVAAFSAQTHRPVLWLVLAVVLSSLLPASARDLLEVRLLSISVEWVVGGALVVVIVNAVAGVGPADDHQRGAPVLRLRSLRLVGRVVVAFGLVLALTSRLVGPGTIYSWVFSTCWLASFPVFVTLVRWWRETVFARTERTRRKSAFERWLLLHRRGWKSLLAATIGAVYLFGRGAWRIGRGWISGFKLTRTVLAYLFRRELGKLEAEREEIVSTPIADEAFAALGPDQPSPEWVAIDADEDLERIRERVRERRGGVVALVGALGSGKSTALTKLQEGLVDSLRLEVPIDPGVAFAEHVTNALAASPEACAIILDDAHRLVRPMMGGLAAFDALLEAASTRCGKATWILAFDDVLWPFLQRARGSRPLFDEVVRLYSWREEQLVRLLHTRTATTKLDPSFENLLDRLPANADEIERQDALEERAASYYRLVWDYAGGNPGIALHMWRRSLGLDASGAPHVKFFQAPNAAELEPLPDQTVFVLRAVLQLGVAGTDDIAAATMLQRDDIVDALRYAKSRGYVDANREGYRVTWTWHRALSVFLQRRHLLVRSA